jgi:hypothetical protein
VRVEGRIAGLSLRRWQGLAYDGRHYRRMWRAMILSWKRSACRNCFLRVTLGHFGLKLDNSFINASQVRLSSSDLFEAVTADFSEFFTVFCLQH